jgi:predicted nucleic acid-binding protein
MNIVDSSGWLEYLADSPNATNYAVAIESNEELLVPSIILYEVAKRLVVQGKKEIAERAIAMMKQCTEIPIDHDVALRAFELSIAHDLPLADSIIYSISVIHNATLLTQDAHFEGLPNVQFFPKK